MSASEINAFLGRVISQILCLRFQKFYIFESIDVNGKVCVPETSEAFRAHLYRNRNGVAVVKFMNKSLLKTGVIGAIIAALCCFTPILVIIFGVLGLSALVGYLDFVLFPLLGLFLIIIVVAIVTNKSNAT